MDLDPKQQVPSKSAPTGELLTPAKYQWLGLGWVLKDESVDKSKAPKKNSHL